MQAVRLPERIHERHRLLSEWLVALRVSEEIAAKDACRIEHDISSETFEKLKEHTSQTKKMSLCVSCYLRKL